MSNLLDDATMRLRAQLAADANIAHLRRLSGKRRMPRVFRALADVRSLAAALLLASTILTGVGSAVAASACVSEDSTRAAIGTERLGCVWWGDVQGNGRGRTVWNRPNS